MTELKIPWSLRSVWVRPPPQAPFFSTTYGHLREKSISLDEETDAQFIETFNRGDAASLATLHADEAMLLPPDGPLGVGGSEAVVEGFRDLLDSGWENLSLESVKIDSDGDLAYHVGTLGADVPTKEGATKRVTGKYVDIYKRGQDGAWKIHLTIYNRVRGVPRAGVARAPRPSTKG